MANPGVNGRKASRQQTDFSVVVGGPFYRFLRRIHLSDDALARVGKRLIVIVLFAWLPLLVLAALQGQFWGGGVTTPFLLDVEVHVRFLVAMPLLIAAESLVHERMRSVAQQFLDRNLIPDGSMEKFHAAIASTNRLRNAMAPEVLLVTFVYGFGILIVWRQYVALDTATWYALPVNEGAQLSLAGIWYGYVSLPIFQFLLVRWYYRLYLWTRFLWKVSAIRLNLVPTHPDRLGGLGFLSYTVNALFVLAVAHGAIVAAQLANQIFFRGTPLPQFTTEIAIMVVFMQCLVFAPLLVFTPQLAAARWRGRLEYGMLASRYKRAPHVGVGKDGKPAHDAFKDSGDVQPPAELDSNYEAVRSMNLVPVTWQASLSLAAATLIPVLPLLLTMMPMEELMTKFIGILFR